MAVNYQTTVMSVFQVLLLFIQCVSGTYSNVQYQISDSNELALSQDPKLSLTFATDPRNRFRRQLDGNGGSSTDGAGGLGQHDESSQSVTGDSAGNGTHANASLAASTVAMTTPKHYVTTHEAQSTEGLEDESRSPEENPFEDADIVHGHYNYYTSDVFKNKLSEHWVDLENVTRHETLSITHRVAAVMNLKFDFYFYGHKVTSVTVATGGFIYMSPFLHQWMTATQYIAPLMANFDPSLSSESNIYHRSESNRFIVEWKNIMLKDQTSSGMFHFQTILSDNGIIKFAYKLVPYPVKNISTVSHPVKVGLSDAYYNDTYIPEYKIKRRTIFEYHKVSLNMSSVTTGSVIVLTPLPTCNRLLDCNACVNHVGVNFDCRWCNTIGRCSDGLDWYRQHWDKEGCQRTHITDADACSSLPLPSKSITNPSETSHIVQQPCLGDQCKKRGEFSVALLVIVMLVVSGLLIAMGGWILYAYKHPTSKSGLWLMEHRPSQIKSKIKFWKSSSDDGTKYKVETEA